MKNKNTDLSFYIKSKSNFSKLIFVLLSFMLFLATALINPPIIEQEKTYALTERGATATESLITITNINTSVGVDFAEAFIIDGAFSASDDENSAAFSINTNNYTGYTLGIVANDDDGLLTNTTDYSIDEPSTISSIENITSASEFSADTTSAKENYNGKWGFRPNKYVSSEGEVVINDPENPLYLPSPTTTPTILDKTTTADDPNINNEYTIALGVRADRTIQPGIYSGDFNLVVLANPVSYSIAYDKNTDDDVLSLPVDQASDSVTEISIPLSSDIPTREHYSFIGWCSVATTNNDGVDSCSGVIYNPNGDGTNLIYGIDQTTTNNTRLYAMWKRDIFTQTTEIRYENADGTWGDYIIIDSQDIPSGESYSWSSSMISEFDTTVYQPANVGSYIVGDTKTNRVDIFRQKYLQTSYVGNWEQPDGSLPSCSDCRFAAEYVRYGASYSATYDPGSDSTYNPNSTETYIVTGTKNNYITAYLKTFILTVEGNPTHIQSVTGNGTYRVGQTVNISAIVKSGSEFTSWSQTAGIAGVFGNINSANTTFAMPLSNVTIYADGTLPKLYFQNATSAQCGQTMYDNRGDANYRNIAYTTASTNGLCWMTRNLDLPGGTTLTPADSNVISNYTLPASSSSGFKNYKYSYVYNSGRTICDKIPCYSYYSYAAATAESNQNGIKKDAPSDICPKGWRLPKSSEYDKLKSTYPNGTKLAAYPWYGVYAGRYANGQYQGGGSYGSYWTATSSNNEANALYFYSFNNGASVYDDSSSFRGYGYSIRCVAK